MYKYVLKSTLYFTIATLLYLSLGDWTDEGLTVLMGKDFFRFSITTIIFAIIVFRAIDNFMLAFKPFFQRIGFYTLIDKINRLSAGSMVNKSDYKL